jgi:uncharacterized protein
MTTPRTLRNGDRTMDIAIITGASSGLGREFALQLDKVGLDEMWLVARRSDRLNALAGAARTRCRTMPLDLADGASLETLVRALADERPSVKWLVNSAGIGKVGMFADSARDDQLRLIDVNARALSQVTHAVIPYMSAGSCLVQLSSLTGFAPVGGSAVYAATKAYVTSFSLALAAELRPRGIHVTAVCPGPVRSEFSAIAHAGSAVHKTMFTNGADPAPVVRLAIADARRGKRLSIYGLRARLTHLVTRLLPHALIADLSVRLLYRRNPD